MGSQRKYTTYLLNGKLRAYGRKKGALARALAVLFARNHWRNTRAGNNGQDAALVAPGHVLAE